MTDAEKATYLARRAGILEVLHSLIGHWDLADGLSALLESEFVTPEAIDGVEKTLRDAIKTVKDKKIQKKLLAGVDKLQQIREAEITELSEERTTATKDVLINFI